ncbi:hypothetical protein T484DRAFT_1854097 [Baffinella frigidus]|nr:hypothetical protein T484DRAFT_1854097 [Cryptophyta sp. CCMP2293]
MCDAVAEEPITHADMGLLECPTRRDAVPVLLSNEPLNEQVPEHVLMEISSVPKDVLQLENRDLFWKMVRRSTHAHELHSFVGPRPSSSGPAISTPTPFFRTDASRDDRTSSTPSTLTPFFRSNTSGDNRTSSFVEEDAPRWKKGWLHMKQVKEGLVKATRYHSVPSRTGSAPNLSPVRPAFVRALTSPLRAARTCSAPAHRSGDPPLVSPSSARGLSSPLSRASSCAAVPEEQPTLTAFYHSMKAKFPNVRASSFPPPSPLPPPPSPSSSTSNLAPPRPSSTASVPRLQKIVSAHRHAADPSPFSISQRLRPASIMAPHRVECLDLDVW